MNIGYWIMGANAPRRGLVAFTLIVAISCAVVAVYAPTFVGMASLWQRADHRQGLLIFPIAGYLLWYSRGRLGEASIVPSFYGSIALGAMVVFWVLAKGAGVQAAEYLAALWIVPAAVAAILGPNVLRRALFPLLFLTLAAPLGDGLIPVLMTTTADLAAALLRIFGVPVYREGQFLMLPGGDFEVADVCSGLRYLMAGTTVGLLFAYVTFGGLVKRTAFTLVTAVTLVIANGVRAFVVMFVASLTQMRWMSGYDHVVFGWLLFALAVVALFAVGSRFADSAPRVKDRAAADSTRAPAGAGLVALVLVLAALMLALTLQPYRADVGEFGFLLLPVVALLFFVLKPSAVASDPRSLRFSGAAVPAYHLTDITIVCVALATLAAGPTLAQRGAEPTAWTAPALPASRACGLPVEWQAGWQPVLESPDFESRGTYLCEGGRVSAFVGGYTTNNVRKELVSAANSVVPREWRNFATVTEAELETEGGGRVVVNELNVRTTDREELIWYWYGVGNCFTHRPAVVKLLQAWSFFLGRPTGGSVFLVATPVGWRDNVGRERLEAVAHLLANVRAGNCESPWPSRR